MTVRIACLLVPDFPLQALRRTEPGLAEAPVAVAAGSSPRDLVVAVAAEAAMLGVRTGMTAAQVRQRAPGVMVRVVPRESVAAADEAMCDVAAGFSPRIRRLRPGEVLLDVGGLLPRFGREERVAHEMLRASRRVGLEGRIGIAGSVGVARIAARLAASRLGPSGSLPPVPRPLSSDPVPRSPDTGHGSGPVDYKSPYLWRQEPGKALAGALAKTDGRALAERDSSAALDCASDICVVRTGDEALLMAPLPVALLEPSPEAATRLACWGIHRAGELAALPRHEVALRLGGEGVRLHRLSCGEADGEFIPDPLRETLREAVVMEHPLADLEMFLFVLHGILSRLASRLELRGEGFAELLLDLHLEGGERLEARTKMVAPAREVAAVLPLVRLQLESRPPGAPVEGVTAIVTPGKVRLAQGSLFGPPLPAPGKLARTLARLAALVGPERVGAAAVPDTHHPGAWGVVPFAPGRGERRGERGEGRTPGRGAPVPDPGPRTPDPGFHAPVLRAFRLPREATVVAAGERPVVVKVDGWGGAVVGCAGPYRFIGEWWTDTPLARDDFDVATADGALLRVHFDLLQRRWFADGVYD